MNAKAVPEQVTSAETTAQLELVYGQRTRLPFSQIQRVAVADPELLFWELTDGQLYVLGRRAGETLLYVWDQQGLTPYLLRIRSPAQTVGRSVRQRPVLQKEREGLSGFYSAQTTLPVWDAPHPLLFHQHLMAEYPLAEDQQLFFRGNLLSQFQTDAFELERLSLPFINLAYQRSDSFFDLGDSTLNHGLHSLYPRLNRVKGLSWSQGGEQGVYQLFTGLESLPVPLYQADPAPPLPSAMPHYLTGGSFAWQLPVQELLGAHWGNVSLLGLGLAQHALQTGHTDSYLLASGLEWTQKDRGRLKLALGSNVQALGFLAQGFYHWKWPQQRSWLDLSGNYQHFGEGYFGASRSQDLLNLRFNSNFADDWGLSGGGNGQLLAGVLQHYQWTARLGRQFRTSALNLYGQLNSWTNLPVQQQRYMLTLGGIWRQDLPVNAAYSWMLSQRGTSEPLHWHRLNLRARLFQADTWQLNLSSQSLLAHAHALQFQQYFRLHLQGYLAHQWFWNGSAAYQWGRASGISGGTADQATQISAGLDWLPSPLHQFQTALHYQYLEQPEQAHIMGVTLGYSWRFGYEIESQLGKIEGLVFHDLNHNGQQDEGEPELADVHLQLRDLRTKTDAQGRFVFDALPFGNYLLLAVPASLPPGFQVTSENPVNLAISASEPVAKVRIPARQQILVQGIVFASPLLARGLDDITIILNGRERLKTHFGGRFQTLLPPGQHRLQLDPTNLPTGYRLRGGLQRELDSQQNVTLRFVFEPLIQLTLQLQTAAGQPLANTALELVPELDAERAQQLVSDSQGQLHFEDLLPGRQFVSISGKRLILELPDQPGHFYGRLKQPFSDGDVIQLQPN